MNYHLITVAFLLAAGACYAAGFAGGMLALLAVGLVLEGVFWIRLIGVAGTPDEASPACAPPVRAVLTRSRRRVTMPGSELRNL